MTRTMTPPWPITCRVCDVQLYSLIHPMTPPTWMSVSVRPWRAGRRDVTCLFARKLINCLRSAGCGCTAAELECRLRNSRSGLSVIQPPSPSKPYKTAGCRRFNFVLGRRRRAAGRWWTKPSRARRSRRVPATVPFVPSAGGGRVARRSTEYFPSRRFHVVEHSVAERHVGGVTCCL